MVPKAQKYEVKMIAVRTFVRARSFWPRIAALLASCGQGGFAPPLCCKFLKTGRFPANLRLAGKQICSCHFDPVYEFMTYSRYA